MAASRLRRARWLLPFAALALVPEQTFLWRTPGEIVLSMAPFALLGIFCLGAARSRTGRLLRSPEAIAFGLAAGFYLLQLFGGVAAEPELLATSFVPGMLGISFVLGLSMVIPVGTLAWAVHGLRLACQPVSD